MFRYFNLTREVQIMKSIATQTVNIFVDHWVIDFEIPSTVLTVNGSLFTSEFPGASCKEQSVKTVTTAEYRPQANGEVERISATTILRRRNYVGEHQKYWKTFAFHVTYD